MGLIGELIIICERTKQSTTIKMSPGAWLLWLWAHHYASMCDSFLWVLCGCSAQLNRDTGHSEALWLHYVRGKASPCASTNTYLPQFSVSATSMCHWHLARVYLLCKRQGNCSFFFSGRCFSEKVSHHVGYFSFEKEALCGKIAKKPVQIPKEEHSWLQFAASGKT